MVIDVGKEDDIISCFFPYKVLEETLKGLPE
jgi:hypothetical protein